LRETLYIRFRDLDLGTPTPFCIARADAVASFPVNVAPLETVLLQAGNRRVVVLVPSSDVRLSSVQVAARQASKVLQAAPYALEDQLAEDVDTLHFALGARQASGSWPVAVVAQTRMEQWLAALHERGVQPDMLLPDVLALPVPAEGHYSVLIDGEQVIVRTALDGGFVCQREDLMLFLDLADPQQRATLRVIVPRGESVDLSTLGRPVEPLHGFGSSLEALLQGYRPDAAINLLQGSHSRRENWLRLWQPWRNAAVLLLAVLVLAAGLHGLRAWQLGKELAALEANNIARYQQIFPAETRIVDLSAQLDQQLTALGGSGGGRKMLPLMEVLAQAMQAQPGLTLQTLQWRDGALYAGLTGGSLELLEQLKAWFSAGSRGATLEVQSANAGADGVQIRVRLTPA
jgi:general secretion pathway protein L